MRSSWVPARRVAGIAAVLGSIAVACAVRPPCDALGCAPACPRDATPDASGRCACASGTALVLGACVSPATADAYCGPAERMGAGGCAAKPCAPDEVVDSATGACVPRGSLRRRATACSDAGVPVDREGAVACLDAAATCPRGTHREGERCARPAACPPGSLPDGGGCRPFVTAGPGAGAAPRIDAATWFELVFGVDGGDGKDDLCRPLSRRADAFDAGSGAPKTVVLRVAVTIPDQDVARALAAVSGSAAGSPTLPPAATVLLERSVASLVEAFRGLGGESSTAALALTLRCHLVATGP
ncbi:MAG: hypothetical protein ACRENE_35010 [Polyangiaceae bacterium]